MVGRDHDGMRLDRFLVSVLPGASRGTVRRLLLRGAVLVEGRQRRKGEPVSIGERVDVRELAGISAESWAPKPAPQLEIPVLHEDGDMIVVDKPAGIPCHPLLPEESSNVASALVARYPELLKVGGARREAGLCHRLDTSTSGVLVFARSEGALTHLRDQIRRGQGVVKRYLALVEGVDSVADGEIDMPLTTRGRRMVAVTEVKGKGASQLLPARTSIRALAKAEGYSLVAATISIGRRHQIRAHLSAIGHPIAGDELYGAAPMEGLDRPFLHASELRLRSPSTGDKLTISAPLPEELREVLKRVFEESIDEILER